MKKKELLKMCAYAFYVGIFFGAFIYLSAINK